MQIIEPLLRKAGLGSAEIWGLALKSLNESGVTYKYCNIINDIQYK